MSQQLRVCLLGVVMAVVAFGWAATPAVAQGRVTGSVLDESGAPIKGADITAENPEVAVGKFTATSDEKGLWAMVGLRTGMWTFTAEASGYAPSQGKMKVSVGQNAPVRFKLAKGAKGPMGALAKGVTSKEVQADLTTAETLFNAGQYDAAITAYQEVLKKAPALSLVYIQIGTAYRMKKDYEKALASFQEILKNEPNNPQAKMAIAMTNLEKGDFDTADRLLTEAATDPAASREVFYNLGEVKFAKNEPEEASKYYLKAAELDPYWSKPLFKLALVALNKGDKAGAVQYFEKTISVDPNSEEAGQAKAVIGQLKQ